MTQRQFWILACGIFAAAFCGVQSIPAQAQPPRKKLIATGWDMADAERLKQNLAEMERRPFDGVVIGLTVMDEAGRAVPVRQTFSAVQWQRAWFEADIGRLRSCTFSRFTDNYVLVGANPGNVDWFDDAGWKEIVEHWRIAAWCVKQAGFKGLLFDPEPYTKPWAQFSHAAQPQRNRHTFGEYCLKARERGREVMRAVAAEYPDITLFCYFLNSVVAPAAVHRNPQQALAGMSYGLLPAFLDGWLDAAPPTVTFVDGCESAYRYNGAMDFLEAAVRIKGVCQALVSPENRAKYRAQVQVGFGIYLDAYWNPPESPWYVDGRGKPRVERLGENVATALRVADEYVWIYGEKFRWWPTPNKSVRAQSWDEALPGCEAALGFARNPVEFARTRIAEMKKSGTLTNLARNGHFSDGQKLPAEWSTWQKEDSKGLFSWDGAEGATAKGAACAAGVSDGCFLQKHAVKPGERYAASVMRRIQGKGEASLRIRWQTADGKWTAESQDRVFFAEGGADVWQEIFGVVEVPEPAGWLIILLGVRGQTSPDDTAWFDDAALVRIR
ncbi:MAG: hypothetical protein N3D11_02070 [Candidatus Sumerlaeia bacterium]|nr:hypothetical protein [Candidatus Sumerlaeia bacterium]